jgi:hypothetical protein
LETVTVEATDANVEDMGAEAGGTEADKELLFPISVPNSALEDAEASRGASTVDVSTVVFTFFFLTTTEGLKPNFFFFLPFPASSLVGSVVEGGREEEVATGPGEDAADFVLIAESVRNTLSLDKWAYI